MENKLRVGWLIRLATVALVVFAFNLFGKGEENLIQNPGFEDGLKNWTIYPPELAPLIKIDDTEYHSGKYSVKMTVDQNATVCKLDYWADLKPCTRYKLSIWANWKGVNFYGAVFFSLVDADGTIGWGGCEKLCGSSNGWELRETSIITRSTGTRCQLTLFLTGETGTIWWDDVKLVELPPEKD